MSVIPFVLLGANPTTEEFVAMLRMLADALEHKGLAVTAMSYSVCRSDCKSLPTAKIEMEFEGLESMLSIKIKRVP